MKEHFRNLNLMYAALLIGQVLFFLIILYVVWGQAGKAGMLPLDGNSMLMILSLALVGIAYGARAVGNFFRNRAVQEKLDLSEKLNTYRRSLIIRWALVEGFNLMVLILALLQQNKLLFLFFGAGILVFLSYKPSAMAFSQAYELGQQEKSKIR